MKKGIISPCKSIEEIESQNFIKTGYEVIPNGKKEYKSLLAAVNSRKKKARKILMKNINCPI